MKNLKKLAKYFLLFSILLGLTACKTLSIGMLNPKGIIAFQERKLFFDTLALMLIVVLPVIVMSFTFVYHYQASHKILDYKPNWSHSYFLESLWWGIPCVIIVILAFLTWKKTVELDPFRPIAGYNEKSFVIQAIALPWKWLFIYPEQDIATINYVVMPTNRDVEFQITTDNVPMSAFFIPQLGSQIYTMTGMRSIVHLAASEPGQFIGMNTQINGDGFSDMHFEVNAMPQADMEKWFETIKKSPDHLTTAAYDLLLKPSVVDKPQFFSDVQKNLFQDVMNLYMYSTGPVHPRAKQANYSN